MTSASNKPILVTGSHRSGSTWVGRMLALHPSVGYIMEPFNLNHRPGICRARFDNWFQYVSLEDGQRYASAIEDCLNFRYSVSAELSATRTPRDLARMVRDFWTCANHRLRGRRALMKDPIALLSAGWLSDQFDMDVVVLIRHPAAFAGSLKAAHWPHPFQHFLEQEKLIERYLPGFRQKIEEQARNPGDIIDQAILLWNLFHSVIHQYQYEYADWHFLRHEDLSRNPVANYRDLYNKLGLEFSHRVESHIIQHSSASSPELLKRDSKSNISTWKRRLSADEIYRIRRGTREIAEFFYNDESWC